MRAFLFLLFLSSLCFSTISDFNLDASLDRAGTSKVFIAMYFADSWGEEVSICVSAEPRNLIVKDKSGLILDSSTYEEETCTRITFTVPADFVSLDFISSGLTGKEGEAWNFDAVLTSSETIERFEAELALPSGAVLKSTNGAVSGSNGGLRISWNAGDIIPSERAHLMAGYILAGEAPDISLIALVALGIAAGAFLLYYFVVRKPEARPKEPRSRKLESMESHSVFKVLDETDKEIVNEIIRQKGRTTQVHLQLYTHVPKATLSRRINSLESRGIIRRSRKGNRNLVTLTDIFKKER